LEQLQLYLHFKYMPAYLAILKCTLFVLQVHYKLITSVFETYTVRKRGTVGVHFKVQSTLMYPIGLISGP